MPLSTPSSVFPLLLNPSEGYFFDRSGRLFAAWHDSWFIRLGLSGRVIGRRWRQGQREVYALLPHESESLRHQSRVRLLKALQESPSTLPQEGVSWAERSLYYDDVRDQSQYRQIYRPVGILPPDQYGACVVQLTEGCSWNGCHFCTFYRQQPFHQKDHEEIRAHIQKVAGYLGEGLSMRRSIFLGAASALSAPLETLLFTFQTAHEILVPRMDHFRGFYAFYEVPEEGGHSLEDFRRLKAAGLRRVYYGLETGDAELRQAIGKRGNLPAIAESIKKAKAAGLWVGIVLLVGAGGHSRGEAHVSGSEAFLRGLPLEKNDIIFLSPLRGQDGMGGTSLAPEETDHQIKCFQQQLGDLARLAEYDIREFVY